MTTTHNASAAVTLTLGDGSTGLASSTDLTVGRCSAAWDSAGADYAQVALRIRAGSSAPTAGRVVELWAFRPRKDGTWPELFTATYSGSDGGFTVVSRDILRAGAKLIGEVITDATASRSYVIDARELGQVFGAVPEDVAFFVTQSSGQALSVTGADHELSVKSGTWG
jgi:hypothetical protein